MVCMSNRKSIYGYSPNPDRYALLWKRVNVGKEKHRNVFLASGFWLRVSKQDSLGKKLQSPNKNKHPPNQRNFTLLSKQKLRQNAMQICHCELNFVVY